MNVVKISFDSDDYEWVKTILEVGVDDRLQDPPGSPANGDSYILTGTPSGAWSARSENDLAQYFNNTWIFYTPTSSNKGLTVFVKDEDLIYIWDGSAWTPNSAYSQGVDNSSFEVLTGTNAQTLWEQNDAALLNAELRHLQVSTAADWEGYINGETGYRRLVPGESIRLTANITGTTPLDFPAGVTINGGGYTYTGQVLADNSGDMKKCWIVNFFIDSSNIDNTGSYGVNEFANGNYDLTRVEFTGNNYAGSGNMVTFVANGYPCIAHCLKCHSEEAYLDCWSTKASSTTLGERSYLRLIKCEGNNSGSLVETNNCFTTHNSFAAEAVDCYFHSPENTGNARVVSGDAGDDFTTLILRNCRVEGGTVIASNIIGCTITAANVSGCFGVRPYGPNFEVRNNTIIGPGANGDEGIECIYDYDGIIEGNTITGFSDADGTGIAVESTASGNIRIFNNKVIGSVRGYDIRMAAADGTVYLMGNFEDGGCTHSVVLLNSPNIVNYGGNFWLSNAYSGGFTAAANDHTAVAA